MKINFFSDTMVCSSVALVVLGLLSIIETTWADYGHQTYQVKTILKAYFLMLALWLHLKFIFFQVHTCPLISSMMALQKTRAATF